MKRALIILAAVTIAFAAPATAQIDPADLVLPENLSQLTPHVWMIKAFPTIGIVVGTTGTLVVDTGLGNRNGEAIAAVARKLSTSGQKLYLTTTHYHPEHAGGIGGFPSQTTVIRPKAQQAEMDARGQQMIDLFRSRSASRNTLLADAQVKKADVLFDTDYQLDLGGVTVHLAWYGAAHTAGDELVMIAPDSVLFSGDVVQNGPKPNFTCDTCTPKSWLAVLDHMATLKPNLIVPDHSPPGNFAMIEEERGVISAAQAAAPR